jgi:hypothetical protein
MLGFTGAITMAVSVAGVTVTTVEPEMLPDAALMVAVPTVRAAAAPFVPAVLLTVATAALDELQVAEAVRSWVELSEYIAVAVNWRPDPLAMLGFAGVTERETSVAGVTVRVVVPDTVPDDAVIVAVPVAAAVAEPLEPAALLIAATVVLDELQVTEAVTSCVELSEKVPVAVNCWLVPRGALGWTGVTAMDTSVAEVIVAVVEPEMPS